MRSTDNLSLGLIDGFDNARDAFDKYNENFEVIDEKLGSLTDNSNGSFVVDKLTVEVTPAQDKYTSGEYLTVNAQFYFSGVKYVANQKVLIIQIENLLTGEVTKETEANAKYYIKAVDLMNNDAQGLCNLEIVKLPTRDALVENELKTLNFVIGLFETDENGSYLEDSLVYYPECYLDEQLKDFAEFLQNQLIKLNMVDCLIPMFKIYVENNSFVLPNVVYNGVLYKISNPVVEFPDSGWDTDIDYYIIVRYFNEAIVSEYPPSYSHEKLLASFRINSATEEFEFTYQCNPVFLKELSNADVDLSGYQKKLIAGDGIDISDNTVSVKSNDSVIYCDKGFLRARIANNGGLKRKGLAGPNDGLAVDEEVVALKEDLTNHNVNEEAHNDIRLLVTELTARINALLDCDDTTLDQTSEIVAYIKANKSLIDSITTSKVNVTDIVDNLTTSVSNKPLSAKQGVMLKSLIDAISVPTKLSELNNDAGFVTANEFLPRNIRITSYDASSVTVGFEIGNGNYNTINFDVDLTVDGKFDIYLHKISVENGFTYGLSTDIPSAVAKVYAFTYKVTNGELHYLAVGNTVVLNKLVLIESVTCDGTDGTYIFSDLNLEYAYLDITSLAGFESNQAYRVYINGNTNYIVGYFNSLVHTANNYEAFVRIDLKNLQALKGMANDGSNIPAQETKKGNDALQNVSAITSITIAPYNSDVKIQNGSTITLKGREVQ